MGESKSRFISPTFSADAGGGSNGARDDPNDDDVDDDDLNDDEGFGLRVF